MFPTKYGQVPSCASGGDSKILEHRDDFVKVGFRNQQGEKAYMVKQRPGGEFRVLYISQFDKEHDDIKLQHVYPDGYDQSQILAQFEKEISEALARNQ